MRAHLRHLWNVLGSSYWFIPLLMMVSAGMLGALALRVDMRWPSIVAWGWLYTGGTDGAWALLSTIATSMITVGGVAFSITIVTLTQASSQFGPRLLRNFMRDRHNQLVLGTFVGTFVYCLMILRTVRAGDKNMFVPQLSVTGAFVAALFCVAVLVYFIHHTARSLQAPVVVANLGRQLVGAIAQHIGPTADEIDAGTPTDAPSWSDDECCAVAASRRGYLQVVDEATLLLLAEQHQLTLALDCRAGDFIAGGSTLLRAAPVDRVTDPIRAELAAAFITGDERTEEQDAGFVVHQLVEIAIRALSPGINDPHTAVTCIDWLSDGLREVIRGPMRGPGRRASDGETRLYTRAVTFSNLVDLAFDEIRQYGATSVLVTGRLLGVMTGLAGLATTSEHRAALRQQVESIHGVVNARPNSADRLRLEQRAQVALHATTPNLRPG